MIENYRNVIMGKWSSLSGQYIRDGDENNVQYRIRFVVFPISNINRLSSLIYVRGHTRLLYTATTLRTSVTINDERISEARVSIKFRPRRVC